MGFLSSVRASVPEHELVDCETFVLSTKKPNSLWFVLGTFANGLPDVSLADVNFFGLGEVKVLGPGVVIVDDELYLFMPAQVFAAVVDVLASDVPQDNSPLEDLFQLATSSTVAPVS